LLVGSWTGAPSRPGDPVPGILDLFIASLFFAARFLGFYACTEEFKGSLLPSSVVFMFVVVASWFRFLGSTTDIRLREL
jgi:hypothetical protein